MKRPDLHFLQKIKKSFPTKRPVDKKQTKAYFDIVLSSPLLWFADRNMNDYVENWIVPDVEHLVDTTEWSFNEFVFCYKENLSAKGVAGNVPTQIWSYVNTDPRSMSEDYKSAFSLRETIEDEVEAVHLVYDKLHELHPDKFGYDKDVKPSAENHQVTFLHLYMYNEITKAYFPFGGYFFIDLTNPSDIKSVFLPSLSSLSVLLGHFEDSFNTAHQLTMRMAWHMISSATCLMTYMKYGDKHAVEKFPAKEKKKAIGPLAEKRPWINASGPHILLLDRLPSTQKPHQGGTHASPKPHRRRGHWKTLNHPRYRRHPQYQKKIFVKPSFVGPRQTMYEGNVYRLVDPIEERL